MKTLADDIQLMLSHCKEGFHSKVKYQFFHYDDNAKHDFLVCKYCGQLFITDDDFAKIKPNAESGEDGK